MRFHRLNRFFSDSQGLDRWLLRPMAILAANLLPKRVASWNRDAPPDPKTICLVKLSGMGSVVNTLPVLRTLRQRYPDALLLYLSWESNRSLASRVQEIDRFIGLEKDSVRKFLKSLLKGIIAIRRLSPDLALDLQIYKTPAFTSLLTRLSGARRTIAFVRPGQEFRRGLLHMTIPFSDRLSLPHSFERIVEAVGISGDLRPHSPLLVRNHDRQELAGIGKGPETSRFLVINPNASAFCLERRWPLLFFSETASLLLNRFPDLTVILIGSGHERPYVKRLEERINQGGRIRNLAGRMTFGVLLALLEKAHCFLTNDSGPMHLGFIMRTPTVALFGPADPSHHSIHAHPDRSTLFYKETPCSPCVHQFSQAPCLGNNVCMEKISPTEVGLACASYLRTSRRNARQAAPADNFKGNVRYSFQHSMAGSAAHAQTKMRHPPFA